MCAVHHVVHSLFTIKIAGVSEAFMRHQNAVILSDFPLPHIISVVIYYLNLLETVGPYIILRLPFTF